MSSGQQYTFIVDSEQEGMRLDKLLAEVLTVQSRTYLKKLIKQGDIVVNGKIKKPAAVVRENDKIEVSIPEPIPLKINPEPIPLNIIYEDSHILVINKLAGITVHPSLNNVSNTLVNALLYYCKDNLSGIGGVLRPGIVHRLDKDTSGCLLVAKNDLAHNNITAQFRERKIFKEYFAVVGGRMKQLHGMLNCSIGRHPSHRKKMAVRFDKGKEATTGYHVLERFDEATFLQIILGTGRTHQVRVHMSYLGHPILGDKEYGRRKAKMEDFNVQRQMLHAHKIGFKHPATHEWREFSASMPKDMEDLLGFLRRAQITQTKVKIEHGLHR